MFTNALGRAPTRVQDALLGARQRRVSSQVAKDARNKLPAVKKMTAFDVANRDFELQKSGKATKPKAAKSKAAKKYVAPAA